jgi:arylsulfatase A-like enzyme
MKMKILIQLSVLAIALAFGQASIADHANGPGYDRKAPNIIVIMADDYGKDSAALYNTATEATEFPATAPTPALESLADTGVLFTNAWAQPACTTTRGARSTGKLPSTTGISFPLGRQTPRVGAPGSRFEGVEFPPTMINPADPHLLQRLAKKAGYKTYKLGKWHETVDWVCQDPANPALCNPGPANVPDPTVRNQDVIDAGFDAWYGEYDGAPAQFGGVNRPATGAIPAQAPLQPDNSLGEVPTNEFLTSALVSKAIEFIHHSGDDPYLVVLDLAAPHFPYEVAPGPNEPAPAENQGDWRTLDPVIHAGIIAQVEAAFGGVYPPAGTGVSPPPTGSTPAQRTAEARAAFKSLIAYMDVQIGRLMEHVDLKDTYVIFAGDNGTQGFLRTAQFPAWFNVVEPPENPSKSKVFLYRNAYEVPFLVTGPHIKKRGRTSHDPVMTDDIYATVLDIIGVSQPMGSKGESFSFMNVLRKEKGKRKYNVAESFPPTATVGGVLALAGNSAVDDGRVVGSKRFRLIARPVFEIDPVTGVRTGRYVCKDGSQADPLQDCLNEHTGIYEKVIELEFYDLKYDWFENDALVREEMSSYQWRKFRKLCRAINRVSKGAVYYQNGYDCRRDGSTLTDIDPL